MRIGKVMRAELAILFLMFTSCGSENARPRVDVRLVNDSTQSFEWTEVHFGDNQITFGVLGGDGGGGGKTYLDYGKPITERARVMLINSDHKTNEYDVSLAGIYDPKKPGTLTFEITPQGVVPRFSLLDPGVRP